MNRTKEEENIVKYLNANWLWVSNWIDTSKDNTAGRLVTFVRNIEITSPPKNAIFHFSADTRYKLYVNGQRVAIGPTRSSPLIWYYDTKDIAQFLHAGNNEIKFVVLRYFASNWAAMPFERTSFPGLTVFGNIEQPDRSLMIHSDAESWHASIDDTVHFPVGIIDDAFLHISERTSTAGSITRAEPKLYNFKTLNGDLLPWRLRARAIPMSEETKVAVNTVRKLESPVSADNWNRLFSGLDSLELSAESCHVIEVQADVHSTAFLRWEFMAKAKSQLELKVTYSEGYELEPRNYPFFRSKADRLDAEHGSILGPFDEVTLGLTANEAVVYEPFWFRTFRVMRIELHAGDGPVQVTSFNATQTNYPLSIKAQWREPFDNHSEKIWSTSIRTLRNCMLDGYSDCPFYEQLQYSMDSRAVGLFHYLLSGDDRLMRQAITNFAASVTAEGLTQSRFPSHVNQLIAGFPLYWILQICDHHLFFGDTKYSRSFLPRIDGVFDFFNSYIDDRGLVSGLPEDVWQFVDWVDTWHATDEHPDKGVPTSGRATNTHTYFSMILAYVLQQAARLLRDVGRPGHSAEYELRAASLCEAVQKHCYDGQFFTDSTSDVADKTAYSQHCQVFAVLCGAASSTDSVRLLRDAFVEGSSFSKCSYMMQFYTLRAFSMAGDDLYESFWPRVWQPWRKMLDNNLSTWEEDDVRQRSDCHAWGSVPVYEYCTELAGVRPIAAGSAKVLFKPRIRLTREVEAVVVLGKDNSARVSWAGNSTNESLKISLRLQKAIEVVSQLPGLGMVEHGVVDQVDLEWTE